METQGFGERVKRTSKKIMKIILIIITHYRNCVYSVLCIGAPMKRV